MKNLAELVALAERYADYYRKYADADEETVEAIFVSHLAYLLGQ